MDGETVDPASLPPIDGRVDPGAGDDRAVYYYRGIPIVEQADALAMIDIRPGTLSIDVRPAALPEPPALFLEFSRRMDELQAMMWANPPAPEWRALTATDVLAAADAIAMRMRHGPRATRIRIDAGIPFADPIDWQTAQTKGLALLRDWLSPDQREQLDRDCCFEVTGCDTGKRYRIRHGCVQNVEELASNGGTSALLCFVPAGDLCLADVMLAQKIALETNERAALEVANRTPVPRFGGTRVFRELYVGF